MWGREGGNTAVVKVHSDGCSVLWDFFWNIPPDTLCVWEPYIQFQEFFVLHHGCSSLKIPLGFSILKLSSSFSEQVLKDVGDALQYSSISTQSYKGVTLTDVQDYSEYGKKSLFLYTCLFVWSEPISSGRRGSKLLSTQGSERTRKE